MLAVPSRSESVLAVLDDLTDRARSFAEDSKAASTRRAYAADLRGFEAWCTAHDVAPYPLDAAAAAWYLTALAETKALATITRRQAAINGEHKRRGLIERPFAHPQVVEVWKGIRRRLGVSPQNAKAALLTNDLSRIVARVGILDGSHRFLLKSGKAPKAQRTGDGGRSIDLRDRALLLLTFAGAFRRSEIVGLNRDDVRHVAEGLEVTLRRSKTDQEGIGVVIGIPFGSNPATCPVHALNGWLRIVDGEPAAPLFRAVDRHGNIAATRLSASAVALIVKRRAAAAGMDAAAFAGHSLRAGFATSATLGGASEASIKKQGRWKSSSIMQRYIRPATIWQGNAATSVGL